MRYDNWGRRIDRIETSEGWRRLEQWSLGKGMIGEAYPREWQETYLDERGYEGAGGRERLQGQ